MKKFKKALVLLLCAVLLVAGSVMGTLAYLTAQETVLNTFTVGNVQIKLDEANVDAETGKATTGRTEDGNSDILLIPGRTVDKDPTVTVLANSEKSYVRMKVEVTNIANVKKAFEGLKYTGVHGTNLAYGTGAGDTFNLHLLVDGWKAEEWAFVSCETSGANAIYEFRYVGTADGTVAKATADTTLPALFTTVKIPEGMTNDALAYLEYVDILVTADAIQAEGFVDADAAWAAFTP